MGQEQEGTKRKVISLGAGKKIWIQCGVIERTRL